jgi:NAD(P) transhydrogenase subunit alpha
MEERVPVCMECDWWRPQVALSVRSVSSHEGHCSSFAAGVTTFLVTMDSLLSWIAVNIELVYVLILSVIVGIEVISKVPSVLHTPLMSGANAIHGVVLIGAIIVLGHASPTNTLAMVLGFFAVVLGTLNVVGGFVVTDRMLEMFSKRKQNVS